ncbi:MAG: putative bifunctional diguanylate cyclase/phosphodiesterase [Pseudolabrys sp.]
MATTETMSSRRFVVTLAVVLAILAAGTAVIVKATTDHLLYRNATQIAQRWAQYIATNVTDLEQIAAGEAPSSASLAFFAATKTTGDVFRYRIFNRYGYSMLVADGEKVSALDLSEFDAIAADSVKREIPIVDARQGQAAGEPAYFAEAYVPVVVRGQPVAVVAAYVDETGAREEYYWSFLIAALTLCSLTALAFGLPSLAWYWQTREKQQADLRIEFLAHHDVLSGLMNRTRLTQALEELLAAQPATEKRVALYFVDVDHFKTINDTFGHDSGDFLLTTVAARLAAMGRGEDVIARVGGDEFVVVQPEVRGKPDADDFARRMRSVLGAPLHHKGQELRPTFTVGVALAPDDGDTVERLLRSADLALYAGKEAGRDCVRFFAREMDESLQKRIRLEKTIRDAVACDGFVLHYQPIIEVHGKRLIGFEALARLPGPDGKLISPAEFIPVAEEMRVIDKIGAWVLREACRTAATWPRDLTVAVNLSPAQFDAGNVEAAVTAALEESGLPSSRLELEITETLLLTNTDTTMTTLRRLKDKGLAVVMDDFGTGYSSLSYLWKFPFDKIKIDRSFMEGFETSGRDVETVVKTIIALGREMNMRVTVEGVEVASQVDFLYDAHADEVQGFYFGAPLPASRLRSEVIDRLLDGAVAAARPADTPV